MKLRWNKAKTKKKDDSNLLVKLCCSNRECIHNLNHLPSHLGPHCNLKYIDIDEKGKCRDMRLEGAE